jgi:hypothetical protein
MTRQAKRYQVRGAYSKGGIPGWLYTLWDTHANEEVRVNHWEYNVFQKRCDELNAEHEAAKSKEHQ